MDLLHFFRWLGSTPVASAINDSEWLFPIIESIHITGLAVLIGTIAIVDFRDRKSTRLNSSHIQKSRMPSSA